MRYSHFLPLKYKVLLNLRFLGLIVVFFIVVLWFVVGLHLVLLCTFKSLVMFHYIIWLWNSILIWFLVSFHNFSSLINGKCLLNLVLFGFILAVEENHLFDAYWITLRHRLCCLRPSCLHTLIIVKTVFN